MGMFRFADPKNCRYFFMCLRTGHPRRAGCGQGQVENRFYNLLAADMADNKSFFRRAGCGQGQVANRFYGMLAADMAGGVTRPFYGELATGRDRYR
jgi:hypothetical protein